MFKVGVTGGIGSGKTIVCQVFRKLDIPVYEADAAARRLMNGDVDIKENLLGKFGKKVYRKGSIDRKYLASRIFSDSDARLFVNNLVHPHVMQDFHNWTLTQDAPYVIEEAALLFESGAWKNLDFNILVEAREETRIRRVIERDGVSRGDVLARFASQIDPDEAAKLSDLIINNDENGFLITQVIEADRVIRSVLSGR